jgi:uncharacterized phiE125 gp8 family phage protein
MLRRLERISMADYGSVLLTEAKNFLRVTHDEEDALIHRLINAAAISRSNHLGRELLKGEFKLHLSEFDSCIYIPRPPLASVESVKYFDDSEVEQTLSTESYEVLPSEYQGMVKFISQPTTLHTLRTYPVVIEYTAGYGLSLSDLPSDIVQDILANVGTMYLQRETIGSTGQMDLVKIFDRMIAGKRRYRIA